MNTMKPINTTNFSSKRHACSQCSLVDLCLPMGLDRAELSQLEDLIQQSRSYRENDFLIRQDEPFKAIYAVRSGMFKSYAVDHQGNERILGFHLPGELIGLDAVYEQHYTSSVIALDTSSVCAVPYNGLMELTEKMPSLQQQLLRLLSREINEVRTQTYDINADQRLAGFLWNLSKRYEQRGYSGTHFNLSMPRRDIASHLNMAAETISRLFKRMQDKQIIELNKREVTIKDIANLKEMAGCDPHN